MKNDISHMIYKTTGTPGFIRRITWRCMLKWLESKDGERILDVAYGGGEVSLKVAEKGCEVSGIDVLESGMGHVKRLAEREGITCAFVVVKGRSEFYG